MTDIEIFPRALVTAARTFAKKPAVVGEVLVALVTDGTDGASPRTLTEVERYIVEACREEIAERAAWRERMAERKRTQRARQGATPAHPENKGATPARPESKGATPLRPENKKGGK